METLARNWWAVALRGVLAVIFGLLLLVWPGISVMALVTFFGAFALLDGVFALVAALRSARQHERWGALVLEGITGILAGLVAWVWPVMTAVAVVFLIGAWAVVTGIMEIVAAVQLRKVVRNEWLLGAAGVLSVVFGLLLLANPAAGVLAVVWLIGLYAVAFGAVVIGLGFRLKGLGARRAAVV